MDVCVHLPTVSALVRLEHRSLHWRTGPHGPVIYPTPPFYFIWLASSLRLLDSLFFSFFFELLQPTKIRTIPPPSIHQLFSFFFLISSHLSNHPSSKNTHTRDGFFFVLFFGLFARPLKSPNGIRDEPGPHFISSARARAQAFTYFLRASLSFRWWLVFFDLSIGLKKNVPMWVEYKQKRTFIYFFFVPWRVSRVSSSVYDCQCFYLFFIPRAGICFLSSKCIV